MKPFAWVFILASAAHAATPVPTQELLRMAGSALQSFWEQLSSVDCVESVQQVKLGPNGKAIYKADSSFDYLVALQLTGSDIVVEESRVPIAKREERGTTPLLLTNGFSTMALIFHPTFQGSFEYSTPTPVESEGQSLLAVQFRHLPGGRSPSVLKLTNRDYPVDWQGTAWIDAATGAIVRISARLMPGLEDLGLKSLAADVRYSRVRFKDQLESYWLPEVATIEVETARQHWRNVHTFDKYRVFAVDVSTKTEAPK
jgi:hypothetical protein